MATTTALVRTPTSRPTPSTKDNPPSIYPPSPGTWRHPKFTEIVQRQSASTFSDRDLRRVLLNGVVLLLSFFFASPIHTALNSTSTALTIPNPAGTTFWTLNATRLYLLSNIAYALLPLLPAVSPNLKAKDQITDIPLTPSQRSLLGLDPSIPSDSASPADGSSFITPPRYRRSSSSTFSGSNPSPVASATPDRRSISATYYSSTPLSASQFSPSSALSPFRSRNGSPFSPSASPLLQKAIAAKNNSREVVETDRRRSFGAPGSGLGRSQSLRERSVRADADKEPGAESPTPSGGGVRRNPHLNYKWLYEKGARLPKSETMQL